MRFVSTRGGSDPVTFKEAVFSGLAPDGGLFYPKEQPDLRELIGRFNDQTDFRVLAREMTSALFGDEIDSAAAGRLAERAFSFSPALRPLEEGIVLLELYHGPTCAFKDFGAAFLSAVMEEFLRLERRRAVILVATSGDTGSAVARAFHRKENIEVVILYPSGRVSELQEKQLTTLGGNVCALEVEGSFDDCQRLAKAAFMDRNLKRSLNLTSANSINPGRLIPQSFYYIFAVANEGTEESPLCICVPSGNFGNLTAGIYAWKWGMPVAQFLAATNINDVVPEYLKSGFFTPRTSQATLSNAMDVGNPSNFERLLAEFEGSVRTMADLTRGETVSDAQTLETMRQVHEQQGLLIDPHTAVGVTAARRYRAMGAERVIVLATADPGKFVGTVERATGVRPQLPPSLSAVLDLPKVAIPIGAGLDELSALLKDRYLVD